MNKHVQKLKEVVDRHSGNLSRYGVALDAARTVEEQIALTSDPCAEKHLQEEYARRLSDALRAGKFVNRDKRTIRGSYEALFGKGKVLSDQEATALIGTQRKLEEIIHPGDSAESEYQLKNMLEWVGLEPAAAK